MTLAILRRRGFEHVVAAAAHARRSDESIRVVETADPDAIPTDTVLLLACCDHPDAFRANARRLQSEFPMAELLVVAGPWLRAAGRTRSHWPASWYYSEAQAVARWNEIVSGVDHPRPRPVTWTRDERWLEENV